MNYRFKKFACLIFALILCICLSVSAFAEGDTSQSVGEDVMDAVSTAVEDAKDAVSTAKDAVEDAITDIKEDMDYAPEDGEPLAEGDGIVDSDDESDSENTTKEDTTAADTSGSDTSDRAEETTGIIEGMELDKKGINPWAIVIAVIAVVAVLALVLILIPRRK